jgi:signal transduction histidine kinase
MSYRELIRHPGASRKTDVPAFEAVSAAASSESLKKSLTTTLTKSLIRSLIGLGIIFLVTLALLLAAATRALGAIELLDERGEVVKAVNFTDGSDTTPARIVEMRLRRIAEFESIASLRFHFSPFLFDFAVGGFLLTTLVLVFAVPVLFVRAVQAERRKIESERRAQEFFQLAVQVSHDIRSPLSALKMVVRSLAGIDPDKREVIERAAERINAMADELLQGMKAPRSIGESTEGLGSLQSVLIVDLLTAIVREKRALLAGEDRIRIVTEIRIPSATRCRVNAQTLSRAICNLMNNAIEAIDGQGKVIVSVTSGRSGLVISIRDTGRGVPASVLRKIQRIQKIGVERVSHGKPSGSGLGVLQARAGIESMSGRFEIESREGTGTWVTITLPTGSVVRSRRRSEGSFRLLAATPSVR